ncbi:metal-dependent transcriptional regulator [Demequina sp. SYSU T00039]|uniref:Metal-dependent transcriptional regulator n=1 Tax=Demequina lignilytica TaxID=3051663 RepID=A0AAW7M9N0_9MICO|nr:MULTISPECIES: metal-dependent transcriptional regulator [unclassified Demequina]MDN4477513.1 metal-dependent transcriptional regulator [Demequina sp. SYSU T00039-1]MDN4488136.1 metal-dependent transcriptional regulator [Demequina sp. SYSU T00039]MDN4490577.1 metal-dependent transcriptional regulator [Demequina sp. SYSU T00068]
MSDLIDTTEMYLRTIYELIEDGVTPMRARLAEHLGHAGPTVSQTIARMERDGLVLVSEDRHLELTERGRELATRVMRKHRLAERLLTDVIGLDLAHVHDEACRWEHVMSERVERRLIELLDAPTVSPYGNPIPGLGELGVPEGIAAGGEARVSELLEAGVTSVTLTRIGEHPQADLEALEALVENGILPGETVTLSEVPQGVCLAVRKDAVTVPEEVARHLFGLPSQ